MNNIIFTDFDGTITKTDTCDAMVQAFAEGDYDDINQLWVDKKISTKECANRIFELFNASIDDVRKLLDTIEIDDYFKKFLSFIHNKGYKIYILSDGYDLNIRTILNKYDINIPYYSNKLLYDDGFSIECPNVNMSCGQCGTCKSGLMKSLKGSSDRVIYIGDGYSDACPAKHADIVFAKGTLYKLCKNEGIDAIPFENFEDIINSQAF